MYEVVNFVGVTAVAAFICLTILSWWNAECAYRRAKKALHQIEDDRELLRQIINKHNLLNEELEKLKEELINGNTNFNSGC